jgi:hypothetical protein
MLKYGKLALVGELSGTMGQVPSPREQPVDALAPVPPTRAIPAIVELEAVAASASASLVVLPATDAAAHTRRSRSARRRRAATARRAAGSLVPDSATTSEVHAAGDSA